MHIPLKRRDHVAARRDNHCTTWETLLCTSALNMSDVVASHGKHAVLNSTGRVLPARPN